MVEFLLGRAGSGKSRHIIKEIEADLKSGKKVWVLVPEQQEIVWNSKVVHQLPPDAFLSLRVAGFSTLADIVFRKYGGISRSYMNDGCKSLLMWKALMNAREEMNMLKNSRGREERYVSLFRDAVSELKAHRISPQKMEELAFEYPETTPAEKNLKNKLTDLSCLYSHYETLLNEGYYDRDDVLGRLLTLLKQNDFFQNSSVYIDSFYSVTTVQAAIMETIFCQASKTVVTFCLPPEEGEDEEEPYWKTCRRFYLQMKNAALSHGIIPQYPSWSEPQRAAHPALQHLEKYIWHMDPKKYEGAEKVPVEIVEAENAYDEAKIAASRVCELIQNGASYHDIAIIARNIDSLQGIIDPALSAYQIPFYISEKMSLSRSPVSRLVFSALAVEEYGWEYADVISCAKTGLCGLSVEECDTLEKYVETWHIKGKKAFSPDRAWEMNPQGFKGSLSESDANTLAIVNNAKEKLADPLLNFSSVFEGDPKVRDVCQAIVNLLDAYGICEALKNQAEEHQKACRYTEASQIRQVWNSLMEALDSMVSILGEEHSSPSSFSRLFRQVVHFTDIGTIPSGVDQVLLGSANKLRTDAIKHVILLGVNEGEFPAAVSDGGYFSDADKEKLESWDVILSEGTQYQAAQELFWFYHAVTMASDSVTLVVPRCDYKGEALHPSAAVEQMTQMFPDAKRVFRAEDYVWNRSSAREAARKHPGAVWENRLAKCLGEPLSSLPMHLDAREDSVDPSTAETLYPDLFTMTQTKMDSFVKCPFAYFCRYILGLDEEATGRIQSVDVGNYIHDILDHYFREATQMGEMTRQEKDELLARCVDDYMNKVFFGITITPRLSHFFSSLKKNVSVFIDVLSEEFRNSEFKPTAFEQPVGTAEGDIPPLVFDISETKKAMLIGKIDRLDTYTNGRECFVRVVDYKTGSKEFKIQDVALGLNIQMLIYLFSVCRMPEGKERPRWAGDQPVVPAGILYFSARPGEMKNSREIEGDELVDLVNAQVKREGLLLSEPDILHAMDTTGQGKFIPVSYTDKGTLRKSSTLITREEFGQEYETVKATVSRIGREMTEGKAGAQPLEVHGSVMCDYCRFAPICRAEHKNEK